MQRLTVPTLLLVLAFAAMAGPVAAMEGSLTAGSLAHDGPAEQQGSLAMLYADSDADEATEAMVTGSAARMTVIQHTGSYQQVVLPQSPLSGTLDTLDVPGSTERAPDQVLTLARIDLVAQQPDYEVHVFSPEGSIPYTATSDHRSLEPRPAMQMSIQGFDEEGLGPGGPSDNDFSYVAREGPFVLHAGASPHTQVTLRGDFVFEMDGLTLEALANEGRRTLESGTWRDPVAAGTGASDVRTSFIRILFEDAELTIGMDGGPGRLEWVSSNVDLQAAGVVTVYNGRGTLTGDDGPIALDDDRYVIGAGSQLAVVPGSDVLGVAVSEPSFGKRGTISDVPAPASAALVGSGAVLALLVAIAIGVLRRYARAPQLADVERAIEEGAYRRGAWMAGRILARRPGDESAVLARGIALSKAGQLQRTVAELSAHLAGTAATDGSLHYVLGLAQLDLGQRDAARASLKEAVRLTPALQAEVGTRLGKAFSSPAPTTKETSGYA